MKLKIEWASSFNSDGTSRKPDPSTMHGWYAKLRGTLSGNEDLRNKGMKEMRDAVRFKKETAKRKREARRAEGRRSVFGFFLNRKKPSSTSSRSSGSRAKTLTRPPTSRQSTGTSRATRPPMSPRASHGSRSSHHPSKSSHSRSHHTSRSSRSRPEYSSRRSSRR